MSLRFLVKVAALASTCLMSISQALAENRMALVIGNSSYTSVAALPNPANDAKAMATFLSSAGFQVVQAPNRLQAHVLPHQPRGFLCRDERQPEHRQCTLQAIQGQPADGSRRRSQGTRGVGGDPAPDRRARSCAGRARRQGDNAHRQGRPALQSLDRGAQRADECARQFVRADTRDHEDAAR